MMSLCRQNPGSELFEHLSTSGSIVPESMGFLNGILVKSLNKVRGSHKLKILSRFILRHKTHQLHHTRDFFKIVMFLKKTVDKLQNGTTDAVGDIQRHHAKQFINLQCFQL